MVGVSSMGDLVPTVNYVIPYLALLSTGTDDLQISSLFRAFGRYEGFIEYVIIFLGHSC